MRIQTLPSDGCRVSLTVDYLDGNNFMTTMLFCVVKNNSLKTKKNVNDSCKEIKFMLILEHRCFVCHTYATVSLNSTL